MRSPNLLCAIISENKCPREAMSPREFDGPCRDTLSFQDGIVMLAHGRLLSHYQLIQKIGEGATGVVWKAQDTRLRRTVALKVLPSGLVNSEERRSRFLREARAAAAVIHPSIVTIYEINEADGVVFIAMELVEGK